MSAPIVKRKADEFGLFNPPRGRGQGGLSCHGPRSRPLGVGQGHSAPARFLARHPPMSEPSVLPVQRFSPAPGIWIDRTEKSITITGEMELFGPEATSARAQSVQDSINNTW